MGEAGECGGTYTFPFGIITSPSYPNKYPENIDCIYTITQPNGIVIVLNFFYMDVVDGWGDFTNCENDYLEIRDGPSANSPILAKLCGTDLPASIQSNQNELWMK